jgi:hypothetical protein
MDSPCVIQAVGTSMRQDDTSGRVVSQFDTGFEAMGGGETARVWLTASRCGMASDSLELRMPAREEIAREGFSCNAVFLDLSVNRRVPQTEPLSGLAHIAIAGLKGPLDRVCLHALHRTQLVNEAVGESRKVRVERS